MTFWLFASALVAIIVVFTLLPMMRPGEEGDTLDFARAFYRDREAELKAQRDAGEIDAAAYDAALAEQGRRLLALAKAAPGAGNAASATARRKVAALVMLLGVPLLGGGLYLLRGKPGMPDVPLASRQSEARDFDVATAIEKIEAHLARNPDDARGFEVVAPVYMRAGRFADAARAWRRVIELAGETSARQGSLGEALVGMANGVIDAEARKAFEAALRLEPEAPRARYYLALALDQDGRRDEAIKALDKLREELPESAARARVEAELERMRGVPAGPQAEALANMSESERAQSIDAMVDGLEARLFEKGGSPEDWQKLIRARLVLKQPQRAVAALEKAKAALKDRPDGAAIVEALAALLKKAP